jgi:eukaryotic-like serine/threonine-protein kinase
MKPEELKPEDWPLITQLFNSALEHEASQRAAFLAQACAGDEALRREVESLLAYEQSGGFIEGSAVAVAARLLTDEPAPPLPPAASVVGRRIGPYKVTRELGRGGMGAVYLAVRADDQYQKQVAIKLVKAGMDSEQVLRRFRHERQILAGLDHPNITRLIDGGTTEEGLPYFVMEYIEGQEITEYCDHHHLSVVERLELFLTICAAVHYAHQNLVIHRDLKPSNILITATGVPKLLDFGIAKLLAPELFPQTVASTVTGQRLMTPEYASPEQVRGEVITTASDVYSLGVLLYKLLTGQHPYQLRNYLPQEILRVVCEEEPAKPSTAINRVEVITAAEHEIRVSQTHDSQPEKLRRRLKGDLDNIVLKALRKEPERRYSSVEQFAEDIRRHLAGLPVIARKDTLAYRSTKFIKRNKVAVAVALAFVLLTIGFIASLTVQAARITRERDKAVAARQGEAEQRKQAERARDAEREQRQQAEANLRRATEAELQASAEASRANAEAQRANRETERARAEAERAKTEADTTKQVSEFLIGLFKISDPSEAKGKMVTARELLDKGATKISTELKGQPKVQATLMNTMGEVYQALGLYQSAIPLLENSLKIRQEVFGKEHLDVTTSLNNLAVLLHVKGDYRAAEPLYRAAIAQRRKLLGNEHPAVATSLNDLAVLLKDKGDYATAEPLYREALAQRRKLLGNEHPAVGNSLNNLATLLYAKGDYVAAEPLYRETLALRRKLLGNEHPDVANSLNSLAALLYAKGDYAAAESLFREALALQRKLLGNEHPDVANGLNNLATLLYAKADYAAAEPLLREALALRRKLLGNDHPAVANSLNNLAAVLSAKGDYAAAEPLFRETLALHRKLLGNEHPTVAASLNNLALLLRDKGDYTAAEPLFREALQLRRKKLPEGHPGIADTLIGLGLLLTDKGEAQDGEPFLREGLEIRRKALPTGHWQTAEAESVLGACLTALQRYAEAEPLLVESYPRIKAKRGERDKATLKALNRIIALYQAWGKPSKVAEYRALLPTSEGLPKSSKP